MKTLEVSTWQDFESKIKSIREEYGVHRSELNDGKTDEKRNRILFRGQSDERWQLRTTLERKTDQKFSVFSYLQMAYRTRNEIESFTGQRWDVTEFNKLRIEIDQKQDEFNVHLPAYDFLVFLRHHSYPSPFIDWTESPYIAAFFAYQNSGGKKPAVYCYIERPKSMKFKSNDEPFITVMGPYVTTHKRHFVQKACYTISTQWDAVMKEHNFCPHEDVFNRAKPNQDVLIKIVLPANERLDVLNTLNDYNINQFTLFQSEDALIQAMAFKHFDLQET